MDDVAFKKQVTLLYYSKMPQVVHALIEQGFKDTSIASGLLVPISAVKRWRELCEQDQLLTITPNDLGLEKSGFPFDQAFGVKVHWTNFPYDIKRVAKAFFEMGLRGRVISLYLDVPISTVYFWHGLYKKNRFEIEEPRRIEPYQAIGNKEIVSKNRRKVFSYEMRQVAKDCFVKGMSIDEVAQYLDVSKITIFRWKRLFDEGLFYVNEKEKALLAYSKQKAITDDTFMNKKAARALFEVGATDQEVATALKLSIETVQLWHSLFKKIDLDIDTYLKVQTLKTPSGFYTKEVRRAAKECFDRGYGYKRTASFLGVAVSSVKEWCRLYKKGLFP